MSGPVADVGGDGGRVPGPGADDALGMEPVGGLLQAEPMASVGRVSHGQRRQQPLKLNAGGHRRGDLVAGGEQLAGLGEQIALHRRQRQRGPFSLPGGPVRRQHENQQAEAPWQWDLEHGSVAAVEPWERRSERPLVVWE